jgi:hypothetical protein
VQRLDQRAGHLDLALGGLAAGLGDVERLRRHEFVVEAHRVQREHAVEAPDRDEVLAVVEHPAADAGAVRTREGVVKQAVGVLAVLAAAHFVPLCHLLVGDLLALLRADPLLPDPRAVVGMHLVEMDRPILGCGVHLDRNGDEGKRNRSVPDRARHQPRSLPDGGPFQRPCGR